MMPNKIVADVGTNIFIQKSKTSADDLTYFTQYCLCIAIKAMDRQK